MVVQDKPNYRDISQSEPGSNDRKQQRLRERFEIVKKLGQGTYGKVQLAINKETKQEVAIKTIKKTKIENEQDLVRIRREIQIMSSIHHPHIIHIYEVFENQEKIVLIMQYASGGELYDYLGCRKKLDENEARRVFRQVASAIFYCHKNHICHRDLKLENILLDDRGNAKIADFGLSNVFDEKYKLKTFCGSPLYASPEIVRGNPYCGPEVDCWSLGVLLYTLVYGAMPFDGSNFKRLVKQISEGEYFEPKEKSGASGLIRRLLTVDTSLRATIRDICTDWWVNQGYDHSLLKVASDMANLTPVRLDLLLALSSTASQAAGRSMKNQTVTSTQSTENRNILSNGYYSRSHPLHVPENGESRRRTLATADGGRVNNSSIAKDRKLQAIGVVGTSENLEDAHKKGWSCLPLADTVKTCTVKTPTDDKNENNTLIIVQDLIKDVISKVEQNINNSKMELLRNANTTLIQETPLEDHTRNDNKGKGVMDTSEEAPRLPQLPTSEEAKRKSLLEKGNVTAEEKDFQNSETDTSKSFVKQSTAANTVVHTTKIEGVANELGVKDFTEKTVQVTKNIPNKNCDVQSRKSSIQLMDPDFVIPIFNVCSNIPKRSSDSIRPSSVTAILKPALQSLKSRNNESKNINCITKLNSEPLSESKAIASSPRSDTNQIFRTDSKEICEFKSQVPSDSDASLQNRTTISNSVSDKALVGTQGFSINSEVPRLPPRRRFLIKIPKLEKSNEKDFAQTHSELNDIKTAPACDKKDSDELGLQQESKDLGSISSSDDKNKSPSISSEENTLTVNKEENQESSPKLCQRKSRRDSSKRCPLFNSKSVTNREKCHDISEKQNDGGNKKDDQEVSISAKELDCNDLPSIKKNEIKPLKDGTHLPVSPPDCDKMLTPGDISPNNATESKSLTLEESFDMSAQEERTELLETKTENLVLLRKNTNLPEIDKSFRNLANERPIMKRSNSSDVENNTKTLQQREEESRRSRPLVRSKHRSLSRTRAMSLEFESLALMPVKIVRPPMKPPGKVEIPKNFDPTQLKMTSPKVEMREIIFIPRACVSENKEKIEKKIEKVRRAAIIIPPRRKSEAGISSKKKKYARSKTDFIVRPNDLVSSAEETNLNIDDEQQDDMYTAIDVNSGEIFNPENLDDEAISNVIWYSAVSPETESEESEHRFKTFEECADGYEILYNDNDVTVNENNKTHRHSVDAESGYWTPPEINTGENSTGQTTVQMKGEKHHKRCENSEKVMLQRAAFRNSKMRMKLSDEGLDMCSLSSSLESGIYSWRQEEINGKRISPENESTLKILSPMKLAELNTDGSYPPIARSFKKMTFPPEHSSTSELSENCSIVSEAEKNVNTDTAVSGRGNRTSQRISQRVNGDTKPIKPSDSQSSYGSNDISDDVFESWAEKESVPTSKNSSPGDTEKGSIPNAKKNSVQAKKVRNWQRSEAWQSYSTDKESSDNDDELDLMIDESCQGVYGTEGLWQFLKSVNQHLSNQLETASKKTSPKSLCHRSKSQESKHPDDVMSQKRPVTRSLSREEKQRKEGAQLRHFVSEGKLADADSLDCFEDSYSRFDDTRYSSGYMASGSSLDDSGMVQKDFMSSLDSFNSHSNDISLYGTLRKDKYFQSASALSSPCMTRRKKSLQNPLSSVDISNLCDNAEDISNDELSKASSLKEQNRKLALYGTLRNRHLSQQGKAQSQILLSTDDGYHLLYNERPKKDASLETRHGSLGTLSSSASKASSELNLNRRENTIKDYEKLLLSDPKNLTVADSTFHTPRDKTSSAVKKVVSDKANRRVSFSSDVKASKSDYHTSIRQNSLNKVREANEELLGMSHHKSNTYDEEQDSGSLLEALKTYGYKGFMSQKLQSTPERYEPRLNYRLPTEYFLSAGVCNTDWDSFEYIPIENTLAYQQALYSPLDSIDYYPNKTFMRNSQVKRNIVPLSCDDDVTFNDILRSHRLSEDDFFSPRKSTHKFQDRSDLHLMHKDKYVSEKWDANLGSSARKKSFDGTTTAHTSERRNSGSDKVSKTDRERDKEGPGSTDVSEPRGSKQVENPIEILSEKIQALKSRCQRKSSDENKLKKDLEESGILANEAQWKEKVPGSEVDNERLHSYPDSVDDLTGQEGESSESVSDRIWRKSFYSRFNDVSTTRRKKPSTMDSELLSGYNFLRGTGKFNVDEEGGVEEPWINTTLKRRNSCRSAPRQTVTRASSLNSDTTTSADCSSIYHKRGTPSTETEHKTSRVTERRKSLSKSNEEEQSTSAVCDKTFRLSKDELRNINKTSKIRPDTPQVTDSCDTKENKTATTKNKEYDTGTDALENDANDHTGVCPPRNSPERGENLVRKLEPAISLVKGTEKIPETDIRENGLVANDSDTREISTAEPKNETSGDSSSPSEKSKMMSEPISEQHRVDDKAVASTSAEAVDIQEHRPGMDKA